MSNFLFPLYDFCFEKTETVPLFDKIQVQRMDEFCKCQALFYMAKSPYHPQIVSLRGIAHLLAVLLWNNQIILQEKINDIAMNDPFLIRHCTRNIRPDHDSFEKIVGQAQRVSF